MSQRLDWALLLSQPQQHAATVKLQRSPFGPPGQQQQQQQQGEEGTVKAAAASAAAPATQRQQKQQPPPSQQAAASRLPLLPILLLKVAMQPLPDAEQATSLRADAPLEQQLSKLRELQAQSAGLLAAATGEKQQQQQQAREQQQQDSTEQALQAAVAPLLARPIPRPEHVPEHDQWFWTGGEPPPRQQQDSGDGGEEAPGAPHWLQQQQQQQRSSSQQPGSSMSTGPTFPIRRSSGGGGSSGAHDGGVQSMATSVTTRHDLGRPGERSSGSGHGSAAAAASRPQQWSSALARLQQLRLATEQVLQQQ